MVVVLLAAPCASAFFITNPYAVTVEEFYNDYTGHFFLAADYADNQALLSGQAGPGWHRTGKGFGAYTSASGGGVPDYRFYAPGPNSHFYTAEATELAALRDPSSGWIDEGVKFSAFLPTGGACQAGTSPIHRLYNNRAQFNDAAHRYVFDDTLRASMIASGWSDEGVHLCASQTYSSAAYVFTFAPNAIRSAADCTNETVNLGSCLGMNALPASLPNQIVAWAPPFYVTRSPQWQDAYGEVTGNHDNDVFTAQDPSSEGSVLSHSYVQMLPPGGQPSYEIGMHVISADASASLASIDAVYQFKAAAPAAGEADPRAFPWRFSHENYIELHFTIVPQTVRVSDALSHGYGGALIEFRDVTSGQAIDVSLLAYGTIAPGNSVGVNDPATGNVWVGTTLGDSMLFGTNLGDAYVACNGGWGCAPDARHAFGIRLTVADFANVVAKARTVNPALSPDVTKYVLVNYVVRNGILGNAEVGATLQGASLSLFGY